jgi:hypothetical protein
MSKVSVKDVAGFIELNGHPCIDPAMIRIIPGYNVRDAFNPETDPADASLAENMLANGYIADKPIVIRIVDGAAYVIAGHRRLSAANWVNTQHAIANGKRGKRDTRPIRGVTVLPEALASNGEVRSPVEMSYDLELSNTGKPLSPGERGANILRLRAMGETDETIAKRLGIGTRWVADLAKLGRSDPRLKALVKAGVIPPSTAVNLIRAHGAEAATDIAEAAAVIAKGRGKANATGKDVAKAEAAKGVQAKVGGKNIKAKGADQRATDKPAVTVLPEATKANGKASVTLSALVGPFHLGKDLTECCLFDANGVELCEMADATMARNMLQLTMLGWNVLRGTVSQALEADKPAAAPLTKAEAAKVAKAEAEAAKAAAEAEAAAALAAEIAEAEALAAKAKRQAEARERVARQVAADDAKRVAAAEAARAMAASMVKGKPIAAMAAASAAKVTALAKAEAAKAAAEALAAAEAAEAEAAALAKAEAKASKASKAKVAKAAVASAALATKGNGRAKPAAR